MKLQSRPPVVEEKEEFTSDKIKQLISDGIMWKSNERAIAHGMMEMLQQLGKIGGYCVSHPRQNRLFIEYILPRDNNVYSFHLDF